MKTLSLGIDIGGTSVKAALLQDVRILWTVRSDPYAQPNTAGLVEAIRQATSRIQQRPDAVGLCVPGVLDERRTSVTYSANVPGLNGVALDELLARALGKGSASPVLINDAAATALDIQAGQNLPGRLLVLAIGTGIGAAVLDDGKPLHVDGDSAGHLGQIDVSLDDAPPIGPDGGQGGLEAYLGGQALLARYGNDPAAKIAPNDPACRALVRALRICHAIYRPHHIRLAGGTGIRLGRLLGAIREQTASHLTEIARPGWTLSCGATDFHAAAGAARAAVSDRQRRGSSAPTAGPEDKPES